ncbi:unnamed protein product [Adineta ricciae]|uniref:Uncharacterized protein n=1 Tax=Adineta ricciae TaxID=249248 RepID=A0A815F2C6_ADIRI|nr:unnamed protein product [Adineta ricciae]
MKYIYIYEKKINKRSSSINTLKDLTQNLFRINKSTIQSVLVNPRQIGAESTLYAQTKVAEFQSYIVEGTKAERDRTGDSTTTETQGEQLLHEETETNIAEEAVTVLNVIDTPGLFEHGAASDTIQDNETILKTIETCINREITKFHLILLRTFKKVFIFGGVLNRDNWLKGQKDTIEDQFETICGYRTKLIDLFSMIMFPRENQSNSNKNVTQESIVNQIKELYRKKQRNTPSNQNNLQKNILIIGRQHIGKTTLKNVLQDPCYIPTNSSLFSGAPSTILYPPFSVRDSNLSLTIIETSEPFNGSMRQKDTSMNNVHNFCIENNIRQVHLICFCTSFEAGVNDADIDILHKLVNYFGEQICSNLCLVITRCELKGERERQRLLDEIENDVNFRTVVPYFRQGIYFSGSISQDGVNRKDLELVTEQFETVYHYRRNLIQLFRNVKKPFNIDQRQRSQPEERRAILPVSISKIAALLIVLLSIYLFIPWQTTQPERPRRFELDKDWVDHFTNGFQAVNHLNRVIIFSSKDNLQLDSNDELHSFLLQQSTEMKNLLNKFNQINDLILENFSNWLSSFHSIQNEADDPETLDFFWKNITDIKETFERFVNEFPLEQSSQFDEFIRILTITSSNKQKIYDETWTQIPSDEQIHKKTEEIKFKSELEKRADEHYNKMLLSYKNRRGTKEDVEKALAAVKKAREEHIYAQTCLQSTVDQNQTIQFEQIKREYDLEFLTNITDEVKILSEHWSHFQQSFAILSQHIQFTKQILNDKLLTSGDERMSLMRTQSLIVKECHRQMRLIHQLCQALHISLKSMIDQLNNNEKYFRYGNEEQQYDYLQELNQPNEELSSILKSLIEFTQVEEKQDIDG